MSPRTKTTIKILASCLIAGHLLAVFSAPAAVAPSSPLIQSVWSKCSRYLYATNLNNGYHFFAPEPGASSLLEYSGTTSTGEAKFGVLPDKQKMRPRLLYHRYFMLTEYLGGFAPEDPARKKVVENFAQQLLRTENLQEVELRLVRHRPSSRQEILIGDELDASETYERESLGKFSWDSNQSN